MAEPNTVETNNEPTLDQFNETDTKPAASQPAATDATPAPATTDAKPAGEQSSGQAAAQQTQTQAPQDPYANFMDGIQIPQGVKADAQLYDGLKDIAKQFNMPVDAVKALVSLDLTNTAAERMAEDKLVADAQAKWAEENKAKYGDNLKNVETNCSRVLAELDKDGKFKELLATAGVSGHPATLGFLKTIGDLYLEKASVNPNATVSTDEEVELENFN
jgi:hypothetical protein